eukprot:5046926-Prymnesium_polylepis.1
MPLTTCLFLSLLCDIDFVLLGNGGMARVALALRAPRSVRQSRPYLLCTRRPPYETQPWVAAPYGSLRPTATYARTPHTRQHHRAYRD